ncbi:XdhC family protein [Streptomyces sp. NBC_00390]|uniref:XdhC family protein n=1 Tax=Streptomyces sp. NBC_00390 TaxID=2975736 RepID=UPI002E2221F4
MRYVLDQAAAWQRSATAFAMATVVRTWGSAPHPAGASMLVSDDGKVVGSVSGGCVEAAVCAVAEDVLAGSGPVREEYGVGDGDAFAVGLTCGGTIEVFVRAMGPEAPLGRVSADLAAGVPVALVTVVAGAGSGVGASIAVGADGVTGTLGEAGLDRAAARAAHAMLARGASGTVRTGALYGGGDTHVDGGDAALVDRGGDAHAARGGCAPDCEILVQSFADPPRLLVFGAAEFARPLTRVGALLGHRVTLCDARPAFATRERFPDAHEVVVDRPHRWFAAHLDLIGPTTAVCVLTHDAKFDVPLLELALRSPAGYVGAMGSRRTHEDRLARLAEAGLTEAELTRLRSPIGLDLGGLGPEETAVSIAAEIIAARRGGSGLPLTDRLGPVHGA